MLGDGFLGPRGKTVTRVNSAVLYSYCSRAGHPAPVRASYPSHTPAGIVRLLVLTAARPPLSGPLHSSSLYLQATISPRRPRVAQPAPPAPIIAFVPLVRSTGRVSPRPTPRLRKTGRMKQQAGEMEGKLSCPNKACGARLGSLKWTGAQCSCKRNYVGRSTRPIEGNCHVSNGSA